MTKTHLIPDESLGGVLREYVEVNRKAKVGDYVIFENDRIAKVAPENDSVINIEKETFISTANTFGATLEPTDIIQVDGKRCRMVDRKADVGEKVIVTSNDPLLESVGEDHIGETHTVTDKGYNLIYTTGKWDDGSTLNLSESEYRVLEPIEPSDSQLDIIARLTRKVAQLERENTDIKRDIERLKRKLDDARYDIEMVIDDIVTLDDRTQPEELAKKLVEAITKGLNAIDPRHFG